MRLKILLIEDNDAFRKSVARVLTEEGYAVAEAATGKEGLAAARAQAPDLIVLDIVLPGLWGMEICERLKKDRQTAGIPVLILTGNDRDGQEVALLDVGADDYLTKPAKTDRLLARCRALLRRGGGAPAKEILSVGKLELDYARKNARWGGKDYPHLTPKEFDLLFELARQSPEPADRETLYRRVWGGEAPSEGSLRTVDVHVRRIRLKLGWSPDEWLLHVAGRGYCLAAPR